MCFLFFHKWSRWENPKQVTNSSGEPELAQRRECSRCSAVTYRRVGISNH